MGALEVYRYFFLRDTCVELDDCVVNIVVRKVYGVCDYKLGTNTYGIKVCVCSYPRLTLTIIILKTHAQTRQFRWPLTSLLTS